MPATQDKSQKVTFVFSNLYQLYKREKAGQATEGPATAADPSFKPIHVPPPPTHLRTPGRPVSGAVLKTGDLHDPALAIHAHRPPEFIGMRVARPPSLPSSTAVVSLRENLRALSDLHNRLRFMLHELEDLVKD
jgi:hypothetical protein